MSSDSIFLIDSCQGGSLAARCQDGEFRKKGLEMGIATAEEFEEMAAAWGEWVGTEDGSLGIMNGELIIRK